MNGFDPDDYPLSSPVESDADRNVLKVLMTNEFRPGRSDPRILFKSLAALGEGYDDGGVASELFDCIGARRPVIGCGWGKSINAGIIRNRNLGIVSNEPKVIANALARLLAKKRAVGVVPALPRDVRRNAAMAAQFSGLESLLFDSGLINVMILARLLPPADFGVVGLTVALIGAFEAMSDLSMSAAIVRHPNPQKKHYDTAFTISVLRGLLIGGLALCLRGLGAGCSSGHHGLYQYWYRRFSARIYLQQRLCISRSA